MLFSVVNKAEVDKQIKRNRLFFWIGIGGLLASMAVLLISAGDPGLAMLVFLLGYPFLIIGLIFSKRGAFNNRRHGKGGYNIKSEEAYIAEALEGVPSRYHLYSWIWLDKNLFVEHLLVTPMGFLILAAKSQQGDIRASNDTYRRKLGLTGWFSTVGEPGLGNPSRELTASVKNVRTWFEQKGYEIPVDGIVVFTSPRTKILAAEEMSFPVCHLNDLKAAVRGWETELSMSVHEQQEVEDLLIATLPPAEAEEVRMLAQMPGYRRASYLAAQQEKTGSKDKAKTKEKPAEKPLEVAPKPKLTAEERERLRLERIKANQEKGRQGQAPGMNGMLEPGKKVGLDGKVRDDAPKIVEKKLPKKQVAPLKKPNPGAFGKTDNPK